MDKTTGNEKSTTGWQAALTVEQLEQIQAGMAQQQVELTMPRFTFSSQFQLRDLLSEMGMPLAFDSGYADFSGIDGLDDLFIDQVVHEAFVAVDEKGTEAAAATAVIFSLTAAPMPGIVLNVDRPFIFYIRDVPTGTLLFVGRVLNPQ